MPDQIFTPSNQPSNPIPPESPPAAKPVFAWLRCRIVSQTDELAYDTIDEIFKRRKPLLAQEVYNNIEPPHTPSKTVVCPMALKMGITKVKRRSGWWWVPPGVPPPTLWATANDPWAAEPPRKQ